jgi:integrase
MAKPRGKYKKKQLPSGSWRITGTRLDGSAAVKETVDTEGQAVARIAELMLEDNGNKVLLPSRPTSLTWDEQRDAEAVARLFPEGQGWTFKGMFEFCKANDYLPIQNSPSVPDSVTEFLVVLAARLERDEISPQHLEDCTIYLEAFALVHVDHKTCNLSSKDVESFCTGSEPIAGREFKRPWKYHSQHNARKAVSIWWCWCRKKNYLAKDLTWTPTKPNSIKNRIPPILTIEAAQAYLDAAWTYRAGRWAGFFIIELFCGVRPSEASGKSSSKLHLATGIFEVGHDCKTGRRPVEISPNALIMLEVLAQRGMLKEENFSPSLPAQAVVRAIAGWNLSPRLCLRALGKDYKERYPQIGTRGRWIQDLPRHTALSHHYALFKNKAKTVAYAGHNIGMFDAHYDGRVTDPRETIAFWTMLPTELKEKGCVAALPAGAEIRTYRTPEIDAQVQTALGPVLVPVAA